MTATGTEARICELIAKRQELGTKKYGTTVAENPLGLVQWMRHFRDELLDGVIYVQRAIEQIEGMPSESFTGTNQSAQSVTLEDGSTLTATGPVQNDPYAKLRKTWKPGQRWQVWVGCEWIDLEYQPDWLPAYEYRRHPDDIDPPEEKPWYPDDSGEWVEVPDDCMVCPCGPFAMIMTLRRCERENRSWIPHCYSGGEHINIWGFEVDSVARIVAYKVIK